MNSETVNEVTLLQRLAAEHQLPVTSEQALALVIYVRQLWDWNAKLNLTRHTDWHLFVTRDLLDTARLAEHIPADSTVLDIGSGGGVPGVPLAILRPDLRITLCESVGKKAAVLEAMRESMRLPFLVQAERCEQVLQRKRYDTVTARAVASISRLLTWLLPVRRSFGRLLLIKGPRWTDELKEAADAGLLKRQTFQPLTQWSTQGRDGQSVLLSLEQTAR